MGSSCSLSNSPVVARSLEVSTEDISHRGLTFDALLLLGDLLMLGCCGSSLLSDEVVDDALEVLLGDFLLLASMSHQLHDFVAQLAADRCVALELVRFRSLHSQLLELQLVVLAQSEKFDSAGSGLLLCPIVHVDESLDRLLEAFQQQVLLHCLHHHVRHELLVLVVDANDSILGVDSLQPV